ncbi:sensor histidine kinase [Caldovatus aquaticus]|nr:HAMP domain-containing sensor histidine kinase [Caldovatus aquaticus]
MDPSLPAVAPSGAAAAVPRGGMAPPAGDRRERAPRGPGLPPPSGEDLAAGPPPAEGPLLHLLRSAGFRFALLFAALFAVSILAFALVLWWGTAGALDRQTNAVLRADALALEERWREAGASGAAEAIEERLAVDAEAESIYFLRAPDGRRLAGNLDRWPPEMEDASAVWADLSVTHDGQRSEARLHAIRLPGGHRLLVGRDVSDKIRLRQLLAEGLIWAAGFALLFALFGAWLLRRALETRLRPAFRTAAAIAGGDLRQRVRLTGLGDEFDRLGATMNAMLDRIDRLMAGVKGVSDAIAHDLRTPIARARAKLEDALRAAPDGAATAEEARALRAAIEEGIADLDAVTRVFQALLRIAEAEAGARRAAFAPLDLVPLLADLAEFYGAAAEAAGQRLETDLPASVPLTGDRDLLLQAVANLLDNAVKFGPPGGTVRLSARALPGEPGPAGAALVAEVTVADEGPGIAPADRARAGERFFRADASRNTPGSGLGLSLVLAVAHLHRGELVLEDARPGARPPGLRARLRLASG